MSLQIGDKAPDFTLASTEGKDFNLSNDAGGKAVVLYFYPKDFTRGCTKEACEFRDQLAAFRNLDVPVYGISTDSIQQHRKFREVHNLPFHLLADTTGEVSSLYKAKIPLLNISKRITYLLDAKHKIKAVYQDMFNAAGHIDAMVGMVSRES